MGIEKKLQDIKVTHRRRKTSQLIGNLFKLFLTVICLGLLLSSPIWLPLIFSSLKVLAATLLVPKGIFVMCNVIIAILFGQSKLSTSSSSTTTYDIYEEYAYQNKGTQRVSIGLENDRVVEERDEEDEEGIHKSVYELNKRVEDFIARVNKQRRMEARMMSSREEREIWRELRRAIAN